MEENSFSCFPICSFFNLGYSLRSEGHTRLGWFRDRYFFDSRAWLGRISGLAREAGKRARVNPLKK